MGLGLFLATLFLLPPALALFSTKENSSLSVVTCQENFQCGNHSLMFPFTDWLHYNCGLSMVDCSHKPSPRIALKYPAEQWFEVKSVGNSTMTLNMQGLQDQLDNRSFYAFYYDIRIPNSPSISFVITNNITMYRCQKNMDKDENINDVFRGYGYYDGCPNFNLYYRYPDSHHPTPGNIPSCSTIHLPLNTKVSQNDTSDIPEPFRLVAAEFDLHWHLSDDCYQCHRTGGVCPTDWSDRSHCTIAENSLGTGRKYWTWRSILCIGAVIGGTGLLACFLTFFYKFEKSYDASTLIMRLKTRKDANLEAFIKQYGSLAPKWYSYSDIKKMTNSFKDQLGRGGYGTVYKGKLLDGRLVAVKILNVANGNDEDFINEVLSISRTSHVNVVKLLGFCIERKRRAFVYEYMPNGSLEKYIHGKKNSKICHQLGMDKLYQISLGVARGLEYLHRGCNTSILHFDIKPHNILLDEDFCPKISDFGLAKQCTKKDSTVSILGARGTIGYIAPELISRCFGVVSHKSDVYSYGMMILEIVGKRKNFNKETSHASEMYFPEWAYQHLVVNKDLRLKGVVTPEEDAIAKKIILVGLWCIQSDPSQRPTMSKVIEMLEGSLQASAIPPKPYFGTPPPSPHASFYATTLVSKEQYCP